MPIDTVARRSRYARALKYAAGTTLSFSILGAVESCTQDSSVTYEADGVDGGSDASGPDVLFANDGEAGPEPADGICSADLRTVLRLDGGVERTCPDDQGCALGTCVPACDAAREAGSTYGCDYYARQYAVQCECYALYAVNTWPLPVSLRADARGVAVDIASATYVLRYANGTVEYAPASAGIPPGEVGIVFLRGTNCPKPTADVSAPWTWTDPVSSNTNLAGYALHVQTSFPIVLYDVVPYAKNGGAWASESLLLPVPAWGTNYVAVTPLGAGDSGAPPAISIVSAEDETDVTIVPTADIPINSGGVAAAKANEPHTYTLNEGQVLLLKEKGDLAGSVISSTKPVALFAEQDPLFLDNCCADGMHQQIPPVQALGSEYVAVRYKNRIDGREEYPPWRVVGLVDGTRLTWDPERPVGAPETLDRGDVEVFRTNGPFVVRSQDAEHPLYLAGYMTSGGYGDIETNPASFNSIGDPEFVNVVPASQFLSRYVFWADPTYDNSNVVFVRAKGERGGFEDVTLECGGALTGWSPVGASGAYEYTRVDMGPAFPCDKGRHEATSAGPFGITVWGTSVPHSSYAYPGGTGVRRVNKVVVPPVPR